MRKIGIGIFVMVLLVGLTACGGAPAAGNATSAEQSSGQTAGEVDAATGRSGVLPELFQLAVGILNLEGTENEVNADTAGQLLVLWKAVRSLSESDTAAAAEVQALVEQIQETLTPAQIKAIQAMELGPDSLGAVMQKLGIEFGGGFSGQLSPEMQATRDARRASGDFPQGGGGGGGFRDGGEGGPPPGEGGGFGPGGGPDQNLTPEQQATMEARFGQNRLGIGIPAPLVEALITYLEGLQ